MKNTKLTSNLILINYALLLIFFVFIVKTEKTVYNLLITSLVLIVLLPILRTLVNKQEDVLSPQIILPFTYLMYALGPLYFQESFLDQTLNLYLLYQLIGLFGLKLGLLQINSEVNIIKKDSENKETWINLQVLKLTSLAFFIISMFSTIMEIVSFGGLTRMIAFGYGSDRFEHLNSSFRIGAGFQWLLLSSIIIWFYGKKSNKVKTQVFGLLMAALIAIIFILIGGRSTLVYSLLFWYVLYSSEGEKKSNFTILFSVLFGITLAQLFSNARYYLPEGIITTIQETFNIFLKNPMLFLPLPENITEFRLPARSLLEIIESNMENMFWGKSYLTALGAPFPFINRITVLLGVNINSWFLSVYHPEILVNGGGLGFSPVTEGFLNFGIVGIFLHMFLYGFVGKKIYKKFKTEKSIESVLIFAGYLPIFALDGMRIHLASSLYKFFRVYLMPFFIYFLIKLIIQNYIKEE